MEEYQFPIAFHTPKLLLGLQLRKEPKVKSDGKERIWIQHRQTEPLRFRFAECLSYSRPADVHFAEDYNEYGAISSPLADLQTATEG